MTIFEISTSQRKNENDEKFHGLHNISVYSRQCYFENERPLRFFTTYTTKNYLEECHSNISLQRCGCVEFNFASE